MEQNVVVVSAVRSVLGKRGGQWADVHPARLLGPVQRVAIERAGLPAGDLNQVIGGTVAQVGEQSFNVTRTAWLAEGLPASVAATTVDAQCGSSQQALTFAAALVASGCAESAMACGVESMTRMPIGSNFRKELGLGRPIPKAYKRHYDFDNQFQAAERIAAAYGINRERADDLGWASQQRAATAWAEGRFQSQVLTGPFETEDGQWLSSEQDEGLRVSDRESLANLNPVIPGGIHTAASASQIADGASAVLLMSESAALRVGATALARVVDTLAIGVDPVMMLLGPHSAVPQLLARNGLSVGDIDFFEINEAFASVVASFQDQVGVDADRVNPNGGAIAHGHPLGATGCVLVTKAVHELRRRGGRYAVVSMCCGGGIGTATLLEGL